LKRTRFARHGSIIAIVLLSVALVRCKSDNPAAPNLPPETFITSSTPRDSSRVGHHVDFLWRGADQDGRLAYFEYILETYPRAVARIDQVHPLVPTVNDARWTRINGNGRLFVLPADTLRIDPRTATGPLEFDRWHTFYLRAVDNDGGVDATPESRTFDAFTPAPDLAIGAPALRGAAATLPRTSVMHWTGIDVVGGGPDPQDPQDSRWVVLHATLDGLGNPLGFPDSLYALHDSRWSAWQRWGMAAGTAAVLRDQVVAGSPPQAFVFAVQGRDDGGAITPRFDAVTGGANNYAVLVLDGTLPVGPRMTAFVTHATTDTLHVPAGNPPQFDVTSGTDSVLVKWNKPDANSYGANATETRFGWNIVNVANDDEWTAWSTVRNAPLQALRSGGDVFFLQCRDDIGSGNHALDQVTTARIVIQRGPRPAKVARRR
jgi:hypothetical protein